MKDYISPSNKINNIVYTSGPKISADINIGNLSCYVTGEDMNRLSSCLLACTSALNALKLPTDLSDLTNNVLGYVTSSTTNLVNYFTKDEINSNFYTKSYIDSNYWTSAYINSNYWTSAYINNNFYTKSYIDSNYWTSAQTINEIDKRIISLNGSLFNFKGTFNTYNELIDKLPLANVGDVYQVIGEDLVDHSKNNEYVCIKNSNDIKEWVKLGPIVDLTNYYTKNVLDLNFSNLDISSPTSSWLISCRPIQVSGKLRVYDYNIQTVTGYANSFGRSEAGLLIDSNKYPPTTTHKYDIPDDYYDFDNDPTEPNYSIIPAGYIANTTINFGSISFRGISRSTGNTINRGFFDFDETVITGYPVNTTTWIGTNSNEYADLRAMYYEFHFYNTDNKSVTRSTLTGIGDNPNATQGDRPLFRLGVRTGTLEDISINTNNNNEIITIPGEQPTAKNTRTLFQVWNPQKNSGEGGFDNIYDSYEGKLFNSNNAYVITNRRRLQIRDNTCNIPDRTYLSIDDNIKRVQRTEAVLNLLGMKPPPTEAFPDDIPYNYTLPPGYFAETTTDFGGITFRGYRPDTSNQSEYNINYSKGYTSGEINRVTIDVDESITEGYPVNTSTWSGDDTTNGTIPLRQINMEWHYCDINGGVLPKQLEHSFDGPLFRLIVKTGTEERNVNTGEAIPSSKISHKNTRTMIQVYNPQKNSGAGGYDNLYDSYLGGVQRSEEILGSIYITEMGKITSVTYKIDSNSTTYPNNNLGFYRKYNNGFLEQWFKLPENNWSNESYIVVTLPKSYSNANYVITMQPTASHNAEPKMIASIRTKTATNFKFDNAWGGNDTGYDIYCARIY